MPRPPSRSPRRSPRSGKQQDKDLTTSPSRRIQKTKQPITTTNTNKVPSSPSSNINTPSPPPIMDMDDNNADNDDDGVENVDHDYEQVIYFEPYSVSVSGIDDSDVIQVANKVEEGEIQTSMSRSPTMKSKHHVNIKQQQPLPSSSSSTPDQIEPPTRNLKLQLMAAQRASTNSGGQISPIFYCVHSTCSAQFSSQLELTCHIKNIHISAAKVTHEFVCPIDGTNYPSKGGRTALFRHKLQHHPDDFTPTQIWTCSATPDCRLEFPNEMLLNFHVKKDHEAPMICPHCSRSSFKHRGNFIKHVKTHLNTKDFLCEYCCRGFTTKMALTDHNRREHAELYPELEKYICVECDNKEFNSKLSLGTHIIIKHRANEAKYICEICGYPSMNRTARDSHAIVHTKVKAITCEVCGAQFARINNCYKQHLLSHSVDKNNPQEICGECGKGFLFKEHLKKHERRMHGDGVWRAQDNEKQRQKVLRRKERQRTEMSTTDKRQGNLKRKYSAARRGRNKKVKEEEEDTSSDDNREAPVDESVMYHTY